MAARDSRPIALGTWRKRSRRPLKATADDFAPQDTAPPGSAGDDHMRANEKARNDAQNGMNTGAALARTAARVLSNYRRQQKRQQPSWSVQRAGTAAGSLLDEVADYCSASRTYDLAVETSLLSVVPRLLPPLRVLADARADLKQHAKFATRAAAEVVTAPVYEAARQVVEIVREEFRMVPAAHSMPWMDLRITAAQRARALSTVAEGYDRLIARWYTFAFHPPIPDSRAEQLRGLRTELSVHTEATRCEDIRARCATLAGTDNVDRAEARRIVADFRAAVPPFEEAVYRASATR